MDCLGDSLYEESIRIKPTADAHTYLGYMYSYDGDLRAAVAECQVALKIDDEFGNTFNVCAAGGSCSYTLGLV